MAETLEIRVLLIPRIRVIRVPLIRKTGEICVPVTIVNP